MNKDEILNEIKQNVLDLLKCYSNNIKIEINCDLQKEIIKISITEINI